MAARLTAAAKLNNRHLSVLLMPRIGRPPLEEEGFLFSSSGGRTADLDVPGGGGVDIGSRGAGYPVHPIPQQKRRNSGSATPAPPPLSDASCAALDGGPWPDEATDRGAQEGDNREHFKHRKASPLSEVRAADTRKPVTQATDSPGGGGGSGEVMTWRPEQLDTAEGSLLRAEEIWKYNAMRGDPDSPHGKVLRELRGEYW